VGKECSERRRPLVRSFSWWRKPTDVYSRSGSMKTEEDVDIDMCPVHRQIVKSANCIGLQREFEADDYE
jgi:hypothetical protein